MALDGVYPVIIDGELMGKLTVTARSGRTAFDAVCKPMEGVVRISVYGGGREGRLGVLTPAGDGLALHKVLTRNDIMQFPAEIASVERSGRECPRPSEASAPQTEQRKNDVGEPPAPQDLPAEEEQRWYSSPDGALVCFNGKRSLIALPVGDARIPAGCGGLRKTVDGKEYIVYITQNGRIVQA